jgi:hypothetical protein
LLFDLEYIRRYSGGLFARVGNLLDIELLVGSSIRAYRDVNGKRSRAVNSVTLKRNWSPSREFLKFKVHSDIKAYKRERKESFPA